MSKAQLFLLINHYQYDFESMNGTIFSTYCVAGRIYKVLLQVLQHLGASIVGAHVFQLNLQCSVVSRCVVYVIARQVNMRSDERLYVADISWGALCCRADTSKLRQFWLLY